MVHFSSHLDKRFSTKCAKFIALGNTIVNTSTLHKSDNNKDEYSTEQVFSAKIMNEHVEIGNEKALTFGNHILSYSCQLRKDMNCSGTYLHNFICTQPLRIKD